MKINYKLAGMLIIPLLFALPAVAAAAPGVVENTDTAETFSSIQASIDDSDTDDGDTIEVGNGTYTENVDIDKELTVKAENNLQATIDGSIDIESSSTTIEGFVITDNQGDETTAVFVADTPTQTNVTIQNNRITGYTDNSSNPTGIFVRAGKSVMIADNSISGIKSTSTTAQGILIGGTAGEGDLDDITVSENEIYNVSGAPGGFGVMVNRATSNLDVTKNNIHDINSTLAFPDWSTDGISYTVATAFDAPTPNLTVDLNDFSNLTSGDLDPVAINVNLREGNDADVSTITIEQNNFFFNETEDVYGANYDTGSATPTEELVVEENYWNDSEGPSGTNGEVDSDGALAGEFIDYSPWLCNEAESSQTTTDGENCFDLDDDQNEKIAVCHMPPGNPANAQTINVSENAVNAHLAHGDELGTCEGDESNSDEDTEEGEQGESLSQVDSNGKAFGKKKNKGRGNGRGR